MIADFEAACTRVQGQRATAEPEDLKNSVVNALVHSLTRRPRPEVLPKPTSEPSSENKLPEHLAAVKKRVEAAGVTPEREARITKADKEEAARRRQREAVGRSAETEATGATDRGGSGRRGARERCRAGRSPSGRALKKPARPERTPEERNAAARKRADADPVALLEYAGGAGWTWLESQLNRWEYESRPFESDESAAAFGAALKAQAPEWRVFEVYCLTLWKKQRACDLERDGGRFIKDASDLVNHLAALPESPGSESGRSLLSALVEQMPTPAEWDTRQHKNVPALLANTRHVVPRQPSADDQTHLPFDLDVPTSEPPPNKPRYEVPAWLPGWEPSPSKLISSPIVNLWDSGPARGSGPSPVPVRLGWELLLAPAPGDYIGGVADLSIRLGDLALSIWPNTGRYKRTVHGQQLREAARWLNDPDNATRWSADADAPPTNLVLWYRAPTEPYNPDQVVAAYVTAPGGARRRGAQIDNHVRRILAAISYRQHRVYVNACVLWDRHATRKGYLVQLTVPEVNRDPAGYILGMDNKVATEKDGSPSRRPTHDLAVHTGKRLPNPAKDKAYPWLEGEDTILVANHRVAETKRERNLQRGYTIKTLNELRGSNKHRGSVLDFEARYRGEGVLTSAAFKEMERRPPAGALEAVRLLPSKAHFAAYEARRTKAEKTQRRRG
jgi:hypothetical protein